MSDGTEIADHYAVLGVARDATAADVKRAYFQLVRRHTPEDDPEAFQRISTAYRVLSDPEQRAEFDRQEVVPEAVRMAVDLALGTLETRPDAALSQLVAIEARHGDFRAVRFACAWGHLEAERLDEALRRFEALCAAHEDVAEYRMWLGVTQAKRRKRGSAERAFKQAISLDPELDAAYLHLADLYEEAGRRELALRTIDRGIAADGRLDARDLQLVLRKVFLLSLDRKVDAIRTVVDALEEGIPRDDEGARSFIAYHFQQLGSRYGTAPDLMQLLFEASLRFRHDEEVAKAVRDMEPHAAIARRLPAVMEDEEVPRWIKALVVLHLGLDGELAEGEWERRIDGLYAAILDRGRSAAWDWTRFRRRHEAVAEYCSELWENLRDHARRQGEDVGTAGRRPRGGGGSGVSRRGSRRRVRQREDDGSRVGTVLGWIVFIVLMIVVKACVRSML